ncbi:MAG: thymidine phosphorylase [Bacteroidia bacterium]
MRMIDIILKKRNGQPLSSEEIHFFISGLVDGSIPDYQTSALLMAIFFRGMDTRETLDLTRAMMNSGDVMDLSGIEGVKADKHSTGGVGDKTSLVLGPLVASCGVKVAKMSGRGMGHTGGTVDKFAVFPGMNMELSRDTFIENVNRVGIAITGQSATLVPADKKIYALRDVTGTVEQISLIASSIMSKKLASGADVIVLDVKTGSGSFNTPESARLLAKTMTGIAAGMGKKAVAIITDMDQPLGYAVGNALEVREAIDTLRGGGPEDLREICLVLAEEMLVFSGFATDKAMARNILVEKLSNGEALQKLAELVIAQGGDASAVFDPDKLPLAASIQPLRSRRSGYLTRTDARTIGQAAMMLGAGRRTKEDSIDLSAGIVLQKKTGDFVEKGEILAMLYAASDEKTSESEEMVLGAFEYGEERPAPQKLVLERVE